MFDFKDIEARLHIAATDNQNLIVLTSEFQQTGSLKADKLPLITGILEALNLTEESDVTDYQRAYIDAIEKQVRALINLCLVHHRVARIYGQTYAVLRALEGKGNDPSLRTVFAGEMFNHHAAAFCANKERASTMHNAFLNFSGSTEELKKEVQELEGLGDTEEAIIGAELLPDSDLLYGQQVSSLEDLIEKMTDHSQLLVQREKAILAVIVFTYLNNQGMDVRLYTAIAAEINNIENLHKLAEGYIQGAQQTLQGYNEVVNQVLAYR